MAANKLSWNELIENFYVKYQRNINKSNSFKI